MSQQRAHRLLCVGLVGTEHVRTSVTDTTDWGGAALYFSASYIAGGGSSHIVTAMRKHDRILLDRELHALGSRISIDNVVAAQATTFELGYDRDYELDYFSYFPGSIGESSEVVAGLVDTIGDLIATHAYTHLHLCPLPTPTLPAVAAEVVRSGIQYSMQVHFSEAGASRVLLEELMRGAKMVFMNREEARTILLVDSEEDLRDRVATSSNGSVFVTDRAGVSAWADSRWTRFQAPEMHLVDPTGAGDVFAGCTVAQLLQGQPIANAANLGLALAAVAIGAPSSRSILALSQSGRRQLD